MPIYSVAVAAGMRLHQSGLAGPHRPGLPFVGRVKELQALVDFYRLTIAGEDGVSILHLIGEAGIGKSRLLQEAGSQMASLGASVLQLRLFPESSGSVIPSLAEAVATQLSFHHLLKEPIVPEFTSVMSGLRRLTRLRPTVIILQDIHLMNAHSEAELSRLIQGMSYEPLCIICASRPFVGPGPRTIVPYILRTLRLGPITLNDVLEMFQGFDLPHDIDLAKVVRRSTCGLPLLVRTILTELRHQFPQVSPKRPLPSSAASRIRERANQIIYAITADLTFGLSQTELDTARRLATLGEVFSQEATNLLIGSNGETLKRLIEKGIIAHVEQQYHVLIGSQPKETPLHFTHTLLHERLAVESSLSMDDYLYLIQADVPIYSIAPLEHLALRKGQICRPEYLSGAIRRLCHAAITLASSPQKDMAVVVADHARHLFDEGIKSDSILPNEREELQLEVLRGSMLTLRTELTSHPFAKTILEYLKATEQPGTELTAGHRCLVLAWYLNSFQDNQYLLSRNDTPTPELILDEGIRIAEQFPVMWNSVNFASLLYSVAVVQDFGGEVSNRLHGALHTMLHRATNAVTIKMLLGRSMPAFYTKLTDADKIREGIALAYRVEKEFEHDHEGLWGMTILFFLLSAGEFETAKRITARYAPRPLRGSSLETEVMYRTADIALKAALGSSIKEIEVELRRLLREYEELSALSANDPAGPSRAHICVGLAAVQIGISLGEPRWGRTLANEFAPNHPKVDGHLRLEEIVLLGDRSAALSLLKQKNVHTDLVAAATAALETTTPLSAEQWNLIRTLLARPIAGQKSLVQLKTLLGLLKMRGEGFGLIGSRSPKSKREGISIEEIETALRNGLEWCIRKGAAGLAEPLLADGVDIFSGSEHKKWDKQVQALRRNERTSPIYLESQTQKRINVSMIGVMGIIGEDGEVTTIPGVRVRHTLGLMVANELMSRPLSLDEFRELATGIEADPAASANYLRIIVSRLRQALCKTAIIADGKSAPRLNFEVVAIDMIEVAHHIEACNQAIRTIRPRKAKQAMVAAFERVRGDVFYPTLYGEFFDAARLDFELQLRESIMSTVRLLCRESDYEEGATLLRIAFEQMPGDEEVAEEFIRILQLLNRNAEAVGVRNQWKNGTG